MPLNFCPSRGWFVLFFVVALLAPQAADRKHKSTATDKAKDKAKSAQNSKQTAKSVRETRREKAEREKQLAIKKKDDEADKRGKKAVAAKQREEKNDKTRGKLAKRESDKQKSKTRLTRREADPSKKKEEVAAKKSPPEKDTTRGKNAKETALAEAKEKPKAGKAERNAKAEEKGSALAKQPAAAGRTERNQEALAEENTKVLPSGRFILRPIAKTAPKVDLKFSVARAAAIATIDAPPPRETGPDVIDVIEHSSPAEAKRLDELVRSEMKTPPVSSIPSVSHKKLDVGKMESERIKQIQEALAKKGYYAGEISGEYNETTIAAMRKFQEEHKIDVTGYATAQSLKLLGLTDW